MGKVVDFSGGSLLETATGADEKMKSNCPGSPTGNGLQTTSILKYLYQSQIRLQSPAQRGAWARQRGYLGSYDKNSIGRGAPLLLCEFPEVSSELFPTVGRPGSLRALPQ